MSTSKPDTKTPEGDDLKQVVVQNPKGVSNPALLAAKLKEKAEKEAKLAEPHIIIKKKAANSNVATCAEDVYRATDRSEFNGDPLFTASVTYLKQPVVEQSWRSNVSKHDFTDPNYGQLFPMSGYVYENRLRCKTLDVTLRGDEHTGMHELLVKIPTAELHKTFLLCTAAKCPHRIVPLRIAVVEYETKGTPPDTKFALQLQTAYFEAMNDLQSPLVQASAAANKGKLLTTPVQKLLREREYRAPEFNAWVSSTTACVTKEIGKEKATTQHDQYGFALRSNTYSDKVVPIYTAPTTAFPNNFDLYRALSYRSFGGIGPERFIVRNKDADNDDTDNDKRSDAKRVFIAQPTSPGNQSPDCVSYMVTSKLPKRENWFNSNTLEAFTHTDQTTGKLFWQYPESGVFEILGQYASRLSRYNMVMNFDGGLFVDFRPICKTWEPKGPFSVNVKLKFWYVTINC